MGTSDETPKKSLAQKGQGMLEYALMMSFVAMVYLIVFADGGFGGAITGTFDNASETLVMASEKNISGDFGSGGSASGFVNSVLGSSSSSSSGSSSGSSSSGGSSSVSSDDLTSTADEDAPLIPAPDYTTHKTLDWNEIITDMQGTYATITKSPNANRAIASEYNLFANLAVMVDNAVEYSHHGEEQTQKNAENAQGWNNLMNQMSNQIDAASDFSTKYQKATGEKLEIIREKDNSGNLTNRVTMTYTAADTTSKSFTLYAENNIMYFESSSLSNVTFESNEKKQEATLNEYMSIGPYIYSGGWSFNKN